MGNAFHIDGPGTKFCENFPLVGYVTAAVHAATGNPEHAKRAAARCTNGTMTAGGALVGGVFGGPAGAMAGATLVNAAGIGAEHGISKCIHDPEVKAQVGSVKPTRFVVDMGMSAVGGGMGGVGSVAARAAGKGVVKGFVAGQVTGGIFKGVPNAFIEDSKK